MSERRTGGVLKRNQRTKHDKRLPYTYYGRDDRCAICDVSFEDAGLPGGWTFHWNGPLGTVVVAETCSEAHAQEFDVFHGDEVARQWQEIIDIRKGVYG